MPLGRLFRPDPHRGSAQELYRDLVRQARQPRFFANLGVPDTLDGRFELIALHAWLVMRRLRQGDAQSAALAQTLFDLMFADMDQALRELGVGDVSVGPKVKAMARGFYGRIAAYDEGLDGGPAALPAALQRNLYGTVPPPPVAVGLMADYLRVSAAALDALAPERLLAAEPIPWPAVPAA